MARYDEKKQLKCSFCGKTQEQVKRLVAGPGVYICDECIELCSEIIEEEFEDIKVDAELNDTVCHWAGFREKVAGSGGLQPLQEDWFRHQDRRR